MASLQCSHCAQSGHNITSCPRKTRELMEEQRLKILKEREERAECERMAAEVEDKDCKNITETNAIMEELIRQCAISNAAEEARVARIFGDSQQSSPASHVSQSVKRKIDFS